MHIVILILLTLVVLYLSKCIISSLRKSFNWKNLSSKLLIWKADRLDKIMIARQKFTINLEKSKIQFILSLDAVGLLKALNEGQVTSYEVLMVYFGRATGIGLELELLGDILIEEAAERAKECDIVRKMIFDKDPNCPYKSTADLPPLFGLPISLKSNFTIKGSTPHLGCASLLLQPPSQATPSSDGLYTIMLKELGAIPFMTTNIPMCIMINETVNTIYGRSKNPWDTTRTVGGSSGGEGGMVASKCCAMGVGNDVGGSLRIPALSCGVNGIKVTSKRWSYEGVFHGWTKNQKIDQVTVQSCNGPIARSVRDLALFLKSTLNPIMWKKDPFVAPVGWNEDLYSSKQQLRIGYIVDDPFFPASEANKRAILESVEILKKRGHELIPLKFPNMEKAAFNFVAMVTAAGEFKPYQDLIGCEPLINEYKTIKTSAMIPGFLRSTIAFILNLLGEKRMATLVFSTGKRTAWEYFLLSETQQVLRSEFFDLWRSSSLHALISPGLALPTILHGSSEKLFLNCCYTFYFNLMDVPTGAIPITKVKETDGEVYTDKWNDSYTKECQRVLKGSVGLPVGVQVTGLPYQEEVVLRVMKELEEGAGWKGWEEVQEEALKN